MEANWTPSKEGFDWFCSVMAEHNFSKIGSKQIRKDFFRLDLETNIRKLNGREVGFACSSPYSDYVVIVWVSFLEEEGKFREMGEDVGWVIIRKGDDLVYCARYFLRSNKEFFLSLFRYAWTNKFRIDNVPLCPYENCKKQMKITRKKGTRQYYWSCINPDVHKKNQFLSWDYGLPPKAKAFADIRRKKTLAYNKKNQKAFKETGKPIPVPKAKTRVVRKIGKPENKR